MQSKLQTSLAKTVSMATVVSSSLAPVKASIVPSSSGTVKKLPPAARGKTVRGLPAPRK